MPVTSVQLSGNLIPPINQHGKFQAAPSKHRQDNRRSGQNGEHGSNSSQVSLVTFLSENGKEASKENTDMWAELNKKEIYQTVSDWFEIWQPWQQKLLLHGLTERCSTSQLESLATTLEPVFHWDFMLFKGRSYPLMRDYLNMKPKRLPTCHKTRSRSKQASSASSSPLSLPGRKHRDGKKQKEQSTMGLKSIDEKTEQKRQASIEPEQSTEFLDETEHHMYKKTPGSIRHLVEYVEELSDTAWNEAFHELFEHALQDEYQLAEYMSSRIESDAMRTLIVKRKLSTEQDSVIESIVDISDALGNLINLSKRRSTASLAGVVEPNMVSKHDPVRQPDLPSSRKGARSRGVSASGTITRSQRSSRSGVKLSHLFSQLYPDKVIPLSETASFKDIIQTKLRKQTGKKEVIDPVDLILCNTSTDRRFGMQHHNAFSRYSPGRVLCPDSPVCSSHDSTMLKLNRCSQSDASLTARSDNFFDKKKLKKLGQDKAKLRTGIVKKPHLLQDVQVPLLKVCKNSQWFGSYPGTDRSPVKPERHTSSDLFKKQTDQIWQWLSGWEDYEKSKLLSEIIKKCSTGSLSYLAQCLFDRLKNSFVINWLPDQLLIVIFSMLPWKDIITCSQVCKRWRYLCSTDEIWMIKCLEYGQSVDVPDIIEKVIHSGHEDQSIDWKMVFFNIRNITQEFKTTLEDVDPIPAILESTELTLDSTRSSRVEITMKTGAAAQLAKESNRLKHGYYNVRSDEVGGREDDAGSEDSEEHQWWSERESRSRSLGYSGATTSQSARTQLGSQPSATTTNREGRTTADGVSQGGRSGVLRASAVSAVTTARTSQPGSPGHLNNAQVHISNDKITSASSEAVQGYEKLETKAVMQWIRGRSKPGKDDGEMALDVRTDLEQAKDIMGKCKSSHVLQWRDEDRKTSKQFAGKVPGVQRVRKFHGHMDAVYCVEFTRRRLISGSLDGTIRLWDIKSGHSIHKLYGHKGAVTCLVFEKNILYTGSWDMTVMIWDLIKFTRKAILSGHKGSVSCLAHNDRLLFSGSHDNSVRIWSKITHLLQRVLCVHDSHVMGLYVSNNLMITGSSDRTIRVTDYSTGNSKTLIVNHPEPIHRMLVEGELIITSSVTGRVYFWNKETGEGEAGIQAHSTVHAVNALAFHNGRLFTASADQTVKEWDLLTMTCVRYLHGHKAAINDFKVSDKRMVSCSADGQIRVWDLDIGDKTGTAEVTDDILPYEIVNQRDLE